MNEQLNRLYAINEAIWIRDNAKNMSKEVLVEKLQNLAEYDVFSNRQLSAICNGIIKHNSIGLYIKKQDKSGGRFSPLSLEDIREALFSKERGLVDYKSVEKAILAGTSQGMISKLTGINQSSISRRFVNER
jgi:hypothetical protein